MKRRRYSDCPSLSRQSGSMLVEALVALALFSVGVLGVIRMQGAAIGLSGDAKLRSDAALLAEQIVATMWADQRASLSTYAHQPSGVLCNFSGTSSSNSNVSAWVGDTTKLGTVLGSLPGTSIATQQIIVSADNKVTVTLCWQSPKDGAMRNYVMYAQINGGI